MNPMKFTVPKNGHLVYVLGNQELRSATPNFESKNWCYSYSSLQRYGLLKLTSETITTRKRVHLIGQSCTSGRYTLDMICKSFLVLNPAGNEFPSK